jgi:hypothetical protein
MAAFIGDQPIGTTATATTFILDNTNSIVSFKNFFNQLSAPYAHVQLNFLGDPSIGPINTRPMTSINAQAYTTYPKIP